MKNPAPSRAGVHNLKIGLKLTNDIIFAILIASKYAPFSTDKKFYSRPTHHGGYFLANPRRRQPA